MADYYEILGVTQNASRTELRSAYRRLAMKYHPDISQSPEASARFAEISHAYRVLSTPRLRALYDYGGERAVAKHSRDREAQAEAMRHKVNQVVDEIIAEQKLQERARQRAVLVTVTLFLSSFFTALTKPSIFTSLSLYWKLAAFALFVYATRHLFLHLRSILEEYTYIPRLLSIVEPAQEPGKPFSRSAAITFLACGYLGSILIGTTLGIMFADTADKPYLDNLYLLNVAVLPPIAVYLLHAWQNIISRLEEMIDF